MRRFAGLVAFVAVVAALVALLARRARRTPGRFRGLGYSLLGRHPDPDVDDRTLADRVRSELGPVEKRLDLPRVHVMVDDHVVRLDGDVEWPHEAASLEAAARHVSGVREVTSHLHRGLLPSDTRPSVGRRSSRASRVANSRR